MKNRTLDKLGTLSIDDYVDIVRNVWSDIHDRRTVLDYALHVLDHASKLGEAIRRNNADLILEEIAETTNWLFGFVGKLNDAKAGWEDHLDMPTKFSQMVWNKYPYFCSHCFQRVYVSEDGKKAAKDIVGDIKGKCKHCLADYPKVEERSTRQKNEKIEQLEQLAKEEIRNYARETPKDIPKTLRDMEAMFHKVFESNIALGTLESIGFHLLEEAGEMGRAVIDIYTKRRRDKPLKKKLLSLCDEVAEVFSWLCSLTLKVQDQAKTFDKYQSRLVKYALPSENVYELAKNVRLEEILWVKYVKDKQYQCPYCGFTVCRCDLAFPWDDIFQQLLLQVKEDEIDRKRNLIHIHDPNQHFQMTALLIRNAKKGGIATAVINSSDNWSNSDPEFQHLHRVSIEAAKAGKKVTRIFIIRDKELLAPNSHLWAVMAKQHEAGVEVRYAWFNEIKKSHKRDIALWDDVTISITFSSGGEFDTAVIGKNPEIHAEFAKLLNNYEDWSHNFGDLL